MLLGALTLDLIRVFVVVGLAAWTALLVDTYRNLADRTGPSDLLLGALTLVVVLAPTVLVYPYRNEATLLLLPYDIILSDLLGWAWPSW